MHVQSGSISWLSVKYPVLLCAKQIAALWGREGASAEHPLLQEASSKA